MFRENIENEPEIFILVCNISISFCFLVIYVTYIKFMFNKFSLLAFKTPNRLVIYSTTSTFTSGYGPFVLFLVELVISRSKTDQE